MKIEGAIVVWDQGMISRCEEFAEVRQCMSTKASAVKVTFRRKEVNFEPFVPVWCTNKLIHYLTTDNTSPFTRDGSLYVHPEDGEIDVAAVKEKASKAKPTTVAAEALPDGRPTDEWRPAHMMLLHSMLKPIDLPLGQFTVMRPKSKAKALADYMEHKGITIKDGNLVQEVHGA